jgi:hypothetical protein
VATALHPASNQIDPIKSPVRDQSQACDASLAHRPIGSVVPIALPSKRDEQVFWQAIGIRAEWEINKHKPAVQ